MSPYVGFGRGLYVMLDVKRMTATEEILQISLKDKHCEVESYDSSRTTKLLEKCNCVPWDLPDHKVLQYYLK